MPGPLHLKTTNPAAKTLEGKSHLTDVFVGSWRREVSTVHHGHGLIQVLANSPLQLSRVLLSAPFSSELLPKQTATVLTHYPKYSDFLLGA